MCLLLDSDDKVIGFVGGKTLENYHETKSEGQQRLKNVLNKEPKTYYVAELEVLTPKQRSGLGQFVFKRFLKMQIDKGYNQFILVNADKNNKAQGLYEETGFQRSKDAEGSTLYREVSQLRTNGEEISDKRPYYFMKCN